jgi:hypothetical protein
MGATSLFEKIEGSIARRSQLEPYRKFLSTIGGFVCFYCQDPVLQNAPVDHVVPWAFVAEDKVWNLVIACASCNRRKSSSVARMDFIKRLNERNEKLITASSETLPTLIRRELAEWRIGSLRDNLLLLAERCRLDGFPEWCP